jgi:hypothetical protein
MLRFIYTLLAIVVVLPCYAQEMGVRHSLGNFDFKLKAGANIGGTAPMGIPAQIRQIKTFNPVISLNVGANVAYWVTPRWGILSGIHFENKGMTTTARVKEYDVRLVQDGGAVAGLFTGYVETKVKNGYLTIPIAACLSLMPLTVHLGLYYAYLLDHLFEGSVYGGYLRQGEAGKEYNMDIPEDKPEHFDFSNELAQHDFGATTGIEWNIRRHFLLAFDLNWGLRTVFPKSFTGVKFSMYNVYATMSFGYLFNV